MAARKRARQHRRSARRSGRRRFVTYPVGVLIRDRNDQVYYLSLAQLDPFRREDLEVPHMIAQFQAGEGLLGLKNAWLVEGIGIKSGD